MSEPLGRIPVTIVTGFLGSGKTTLINRVIRDGGLGRVAALVNDFGAIDIDAALIESVADRVVQLTNGCVCCTISGDLFQAARDLLDIEPPIERIVVETTGLADPLPVGLTFLKTELRTRCFLEAVVTVVDSANFALDLFKSDAASAQIAHADVIVINKIDLVSHAVVRDLEARIAVLRPRARMLTATNGAVPLAAISALDREPELERLATGSHAHLLRDGFEAHATTFDGVVSGAALNRWLAGSVPAGLFRAKGLLAIDSPGRWFVFQLCGGRATFEPYPGFPDSNRLVFIGRAITNEDLDRAVHNLRAPAIERAA